MDDRLGACERAAHAVAVAQVEVADLDREPVEAVGVLVVADEREHLVLAPQQLAHDVRADEAVRARDRAQRHDLPPLPSGALLHADRGAGELLAEVPHGAAHLVRVRDHVAAGARDPGAVLLRRFSGGRNLTTFIPAPATCERIRCLVKSGTVTSWQ